jgi:hypothetical protein
MVEEAEEAIRRWTKVERTCAEQGLKYGPMIAQRKNMASQNVSMYSPTVNLYREDVETFRSVLMQLQEEEVDTHI